jgi:hypothetical protein
MMTSPQVSRLFFKACYFGDRTLADKQLVQRLINRESGLKIGIRLANQFQSLLVSQKVKHCLLLKAPREIPSSYLMSDPAHENGATLSAN